MQPSPSSITRTFSSSQSESLCPLNINSSFFLACSPWQPPFSFSSTYFSTQGTSYSKILIVHMQLAYFTYFQDSSMLKHVSKFSSFLRLTSIPLVMVFPVVMYGCESWTVKKAEHQRIDAFQLWCWRRLLRDRWTARRSNQSILKQISPGCSLEGLMLKLKLQYFGHLMQRIDSLEKTLMLGGIGGRRRRG